MSPRPRTVTDAAIFAATARAISRSGLSRLTLARVAEEVGLTAGALVRRFGSKRKLLLALSEDSVAGLAPRFAAIRQAHRSPLAALYAYAGEAEDWVRTPEELANNLAFLETDLVDPEFRAPALAFFRAERAEIRALLEAAVKKGELAGTLDAKRTAAAVQVAINGSRITWAVLQEGTLTQWTRTNLDTLLLPARRGRRKVSRTPLSSKE